MSVGRNLNPAFLKLRRDEQVRGRGSDLGSSSDGDLDFLRVTEN